MSHCSSYDESSGQVTDKGDPNTLLSINVIAQGIAHRLINLVHTRRKKEEEMVSLQLLRCFFMFYRFGVVSCVCFIITDKLRENEPNVCKDIMSCIVHLFLIQVFSFFFVSRVLPEGRRRSSTEQRPQMTRSCRVH